MEIPNWVYSQDRDISVSFSNPSYLMSRNKSMDAEIDF